MSATHLPRSVTGPPGPTLAADSWSFDASQRTLLLRGAVARHLTGRPFCRLSLDEFLSRLPEPDVRTPQRLLLGPPPPQPVEVKLLDPEGQEATFGFTVAASGRRRRRGLVHLLDGGFDPTGAARRSALERLIGAIDLSRTGAVLLLLQVEESSLIGGFEFWNPLIGRIMRRLEQVADVRLACQLSDDVLAVLVEGGQPSRALELVREIGDGGLGLEGLERLGAMAAGVAVYPMHGRSAAELCRAASIALAAARRSGPNATAVFDEALAAEVMERRALLAALRGALGRGEFNLLYQPVIDLPLRRLHGVEVLLRWHHPTLGAVSPERFVPLLEELGQIRSVTEWLIERSSADLKELLASDPTLRLALNLVPAQIEPQQMAALLAQLSSVGCARVTLEITERAVLDASPATVAALAAAKAAGVEVAIDDFGTGYSSLVYLERFAIDVVKIDKRFIAGLEQDGRLADAILSMASALGLKPVAEGVETDAQLAWLASRGCRYVQGYLFAPPLDRVAIAAYARDFSFPAGKLDAALWPRARALPRLLSENQEQALRLFVRHVPAAVAMFDGEMRYLVASDRWLEDYGIREQEIVGRCHYDVLPDTPERWRRIHARCLAEGLVERCEEDFHIRPDGSREWLRWEVHPFRNRVGDVAGLIVFSEFVTARMEAERRLALSEQRLRDYLATASDWAWEMDTELRLTALVGDIARQGVDPEQLLGRTRWEIAGIADPEADPFWAAHKADLDARRPFRDLVYLFKDRAGRDRWMLISGRPVLAPDGRFGGYRGTARDVTAGRMADAEHGRQHDCLELACELARLAYWEVDYEHGTVEWSSRLYEIAGRDPSSFKPDLRSRFEIFHPDDRVRFTEIVQTAVAQRGAFDVRGRIIRPDGSIVHVVSRGRARTDADGRVRRYFGFILDITDQAQAELALEARSRENELYRAMIDALPDYIYAKDQTGRYLAANAATARLMRVGSVAEVIGRTDYDIYPAELAQAWRADEDAFFERDGELVILEQPCWQLDGQPGWQCTLMTPLRDGGGHVVGFVGHSRDVSEQKQAAELARRLRAEAGQARDLLDMATGAMTDGFALFDPDDRLAHANEAFAKVYGLSAAALIGQRFEDLLRLPRHSTGIDLRDGGFDAWLRHRMEQHRRADGSPVEIWYRGEAFLVREQRMPNGWIVLLRSHVTHLKQVEQELRRLATTDTLTGAFNRRHFIDNGERLLARCGQGGEGVALLLLDVDRFKMVNDSWGHAVGDEALRRVCDACQQRLRPGDLFARWGGEEFILLLPCATRQDALAIAERLRSGVAELRLEGPKAEFRVTLSVGAAIGGPGVELEELTREADRALYRAKASGRDRVVMADQEINPNPRQPGGSESRGDAAVDR